MKKQQRRTTKRWFNGSLLAFGFLILFAAGIPAKEGELNPERKKTFQKQITELQVMLDEYHHGKRGDADGYAILWNMLRRYAVIGSTTTAEFQELKKEYAALEEKHPDFKKNPLREVKKQSEARQDAEMHHRKIAEKILQPLAPKDSMRLDTLGYDRHAIFLYQYHLEFYELPHAMELKRKDSDASKSLELLNHGKTVPPTEYGQQDLRPFKIMTFRHKIQTSAWGPIEFRHFIWVCDDLRPGYDGYGGSDNEEREILQSKYPYTRGLMPWRNKSAGYAEFCGAISTEGNIIYQLPIEQHTPNIIFQIRQMNSDGTSVAIEVGQDVEISVKNSKLIVDAQSGDITHTFGNVREVLIYTFPDKLESFITNDTDKIRDALIKHGFRKPFYGYLQ